MPARFVYLSVRAKPSLPTKYKDAPVQAQSLAIFPVFCGISGSTSSAGISGSTGSTGISGSTSSTGSTGTVDTPAPAPVPAME